VWVEEVRQVPDAEGRREEQQQREADHVHGRAEGEHRRGLEGARSACARAGRAPHACRHAAEDPEEQAAAQEPEVGRIAARPQVADLGTAPEHARLAEVEVQQRAVEVVAQAAPEGRARVLLRAQRAHAAVGDDRDDEEGERAESEAAKSEPEQGRNLGTAA
jgi:hypothetical protein